MRRIVSVALIVAWAGAAGITHQHQLLGTSASRARIGHALREAAAGLDPRGHLLVAFTGHSDREPADLDEPPGIGWCVHDGPLPLAEVAALLSAVPPAGGPRGSWCQRECRVPGSNRLNVATRRS